MYATQIGSFELDDIDNMNNELNKIVYSLREENNNTDQYSMAGLHGYHTDIDILKIDNKYIKLFHKEISNQFIEYYNTTTDYDLRNKNVSMVGWGMIYGPGDYSKTHTHPSADIVLAYYTKVPSNMMTEYDRQNAIGNNNSITNTMPGTLHTIDPRGAARWDMNYTDNSLQEFKAKEGTGIIFPGWLEHYVTPHYVEDDRVCIAVNLKII